LRQGLLLAFTDGVAIISDKAPVSFAPTIMFSFRTFIGRSMHVGLSKKVRKENRALMLI
jgi:hypothetical protein